MNAINLFRGINEFALSPFNYYIGLLPIDENEHNLIDKEIRNILREFKIVRNAANMDRLYLKKNMTGRGHVSLVEKVNHGTDSNELRTSVGCVAQIIEMDVSSSQVATKGILVFDSHLGTHGNETIILVFPIQ